MGRSARMVNFYPPRWGYWAEDLRQKREDEETND